MFSSRYATDWFSISRSSPIILKSRSTVYNSLTVITCCVFVAVGVIGEEIFSTKVVFSHFIAVSDFYTWLLTFPRAYISMPRWFSAKSYTRQILHTLRDTSPIPPTDTIVKIVAQRFQLDHHRMFQRSQLCRDLRSGILSCEYLQFIYQTRSYSYTSIYGSYSHITNLWL